MLESNLTASIPGNEDVASRKRCSTTCSLLSPSIPTRVRSPRRPDLPRSGSYSAPSASAEIVESRRLHILSAIRP